MLLSIVIPAYDRPKALAYAIQSFVDQITGRYDDEVEIIVADDASPDDSLAFVADLAKKHTFLRYQRYPHNIGLEKNLLASSVKATGEYLWIFGDDDFLETDDALSNIIKRLKTGQFDMLVLNRTRRSADLSTLLSDNWMRLDGSDQTFTGLKQFCLQYGFISVIGFISVNIFRRSVFQSIEATKYFGTMYPQLGGMLEAFHDRPVQLVAQPLVCHRTETAEEKRAKLGTKATEGDFMANTKSRNALYFSHPYIAMLDELINKGAFHPEDIVQIPENTVINGLLVDFLIDCAELSLTHPERFDQAEWERTCLFFERLPLSTEQAARTKTIVTKSGYASCDKRVMTANAGRAESNSQMMTISVVTTSYNQADYLDECLSSVRDQSYPAMEHLVFDPGSTDGSRSVARKYDHIKLFEEADEGQSDALNKGFSKAKGDVIAWLNSDDVFAHSNVFQRVIDRFNQDDAPDIVYGKGIFIGEQGEKLRDCYINKLPESLPWRLQQEDGILQPALFMKRSVIEKIGELTGSLHYCMDYEYWIRCMKAGIKFAYIDENLALARYHDSNKTFGQRGNSYHEVCEMLMSHFGYVNHNWLKRYAEFLCDGFDGVLAHGANTKVSDTAKLDTIYDQLLQDYNASHLIYSMLEANASQRGMGDTLREMRQRGIKPMTPCKEIPLYTETKPGHALYTVGPKRWAFNAKWKKKQIDKSHNYLRGKIAKRKSDVCVIVGNGPSLRKTDLDLLRGHDVIISNNAFLDPKLNEYATYYTVVNYLVAEQSSHNINRVEGIDKILPYWTSYCLNEGPNTYFIDAVGHAAFSKDLFKNASWRHTVTFYNMHIAFGLGYKRVILIGFDHSYKQKAGIKEGEIVLSNEKDENHFDSRYFQGKKWQAADVNMMEEMYQLAKKAYLEEGRELINATVGGALEIFPRMELKKALEMQPAPESEIKRTSQPAIKAHTRDQHAQVDETAVVAELLHVRQGPEHCMLDVGAHIGTSAEYFHGNGWSIHCFEPDAANRKQLFKRFNESTQVVIDPRAVSDEPARGVNFFTSPESTGISGLHAFRDTHQVSDTVDVTTVAEIIKARGLSKIDFLKIDVEGFDLSVLKGVPWNELKPDVVECEFEDAKTLRLGHNWKDVAEYLRNRGYTVYISEWHAIVRYGISHDWRLVAPYPGHDMPDDAWGNIVAFLDDPGYDAVNQAFERLVTFRAPAPVAKQSQPKTTAATAPPATVQAVATPQSTTQPLSARAVNSESSVPMLKRVSDSSPATLIDEPQNAYVRGARRIHRLSPRLYGFMRFIKKIGSHIWARRLWTLPLLLIVSGVLLAPFLGIDLIANRFGYFSIVAGFLLTIVLFYVAFRAHSHAETLHIQLGIQNAEIAQLREQIGSARTLFATGNRTATIEFVREEITQSVTPQIHDVTKKLASEQAQSRTLEAQVKSLKEANSEKINDFFGQLATLRSTSDTMGARLTVAHQQAQAIDAVTTRLEDLEGSHTDSLAKLQHALGQQVKKLQGADKLHSQLAGDINALLQRADKADTSYKDMDVAMQGVGDRLGTLGDAHQTLATDAQATQTKIDDMDTAIQSVGDQLSTLDEAHQALVTDAQATQTKIDDMAQAAATLAGDIDERVVILRSEIEAQANALQSKVEGSSEIFSGKLEETTKTLTNEISEIATHIVPVTTKLDAVSSALKEVSDKSAETDKWAQFNNATWYQHFNRRLKNEHFHTLDTEWRKRLSVPIARSSLGYMANRACMIEQQLDGRLATSIEDVLLRTLVARAVKGKSASILEIGTLFGTGAGIMYDAMVGHYNDIHFTLLDPLEGYYNAEQADILTGQLVNEGTLRRNLNRVGLGDDNLTLIKHLSTDPEAIVAAAEREYDVMIIDGDHSYAGVKTDFENYARNVKLGGFIIFDDYASPDWPEVQDYVDSEISQVDFVSKVGSSWRTCVYRVVKKPALQKVKRSAPRRKVAPPVKAE